MAIETVNQINVYVELNNGTDSLGHVKTVNASLGNFSETNYDGDKALAFVSALAPCLSKTVVRVRKAVISTITAA